MSPSALDTINESKRGHKGSFSTKIITRPKKREIENTSQISHILKVHRKCTG
jgi:hypothetical protein